MNTSPLPRHNIGAICSQVSFDKVTHAVHLLNIQNVFQTPTLPATLSQFVVANQWTNAQGTFLQQLEIFTPSGALLAERKNQFTITSSPPISCHWCIDSFSMMLTLRETGVYFVTISIGRQEGPLESVCNIPFECRLIPVQQTGG